MKHRPASGAQEPRAHRLLDQIAAPLELDLTGLTVYTEAASGSYLFTPVLAAKAGASVIAVAANSRYASASEVEDSTVEAASRAGVEERLRVVRAKNPDDVARADIITNSGFVRPIDASMIEAMKPTAVIPLMWEPWELRGDDLDLPSCKRKGILVLGTDEAAEGVEMTGYSGAVAIKLLLELGLELIRTKVLLLGAQRTLGAMIRRHLTAIGSEVAWFGGGEPEAAPYSGLSDFFESEGSSCDAILVAEHRHPDLLLGKGGYLECDNILARSPDIRIGVIAGNVNALEIEQSGLRYAPNQIRPFGYMSYQAYELGPRPVLELYAAGLKVGATMARARLAGMSPSDAARFSVENSPALDLLGDDAWV